MSNVITLPIGQKQPGSTAHYEEFAEYGRVGFLTVALARRTDGPAGLVHIVVIGAAIGVEIVVTMSDDEKGRAIADLTGRAVLRAVELSETEFAAAICPEAC